MIVREIIDKLNVGIEDDKYAQHVMIDTGDNDAWVDIYESDDKKLQRFYDREIIDLWLTFDMTRRGSVPVLGIRVK